jgi:hypothetical protein
MTTEEERLDGIDRKPQPWWSSYRQGCRIRERRIDEAVRSYTPLVNRVTWLRWFLREAPFDTPFSRDCIECIRAEYRRIVEREEGRG